MKNPNKNDLSNINELFKQALLFYADEESYIENQNVNSVLSSKIELDNGHQANFALKQAELILSYQDEIFDDLEKYIDENGNNINNIDEIKKIINEFKKLKE